MYSAFQSNNDANETETFSVDAPGMQEMVHIAALNSRVKFDKTDVPFDKREILGDATETGLIRFAGRQVGDYDALQKQHPKVFEIPFNSTNKWALTIVSRSPAHNSRITLTSSQLDKPHASGKLTLYIKGAPERVLDKCTTYLKDGSIEPMSDEFKVAYDEAYNVRTNVRLCVLLLTELPLVHGIERSPRDCVRAEATPRRRIRPIIRLFQERWPVPE